MAELHDPDKPAGYVVSVDKDTEVATRNDGWFLQPASRNPWYILMTIAGESDREFPLGPSEDLQKQNRRLWNGWCCSAIREDKRGTIADIMSLREEDLRPLNEKEQQELVTEFKRRTGGEVDTPDPKDIIDLTFCYIDRVVDLRGYIFLCPTDFRFATFECDVEISKTNFLTHAKFGSATFCGDAYFRSASFVMGGSFNSTRFDGFAEFELCEFNDSMDFDATVFEEGANFVSSVFNGKASFKSSNFHSSARFVSAEFKKFTSFVSATFAESAEFSEGKFGGPTTFSRSRFLGLVPTFFQRDFHQDTHMTTHPDNWPPIQSGEAVEAKRAYTRLRQIMNDLHKPDAEAFFGRQELRCDAELSSVFFRVLSHSFGLMSFFGHSITRPALWLIGLITVFWGILGSYLKHGKDVEGVAAIWQGLGLSIANTFPYLGFRRRYLADDHFKDFAGWVEWLGGLQTVLGGVFLFFLLLGLRNRFRLK